MFSTFIDGDHLNAMQCKADSPALCRRRQQASDSISHPADKHQCSEIINVETTSMRHGAKGIDAWYVDYHYIH